MSPNVSQTTVEKGIELGDINVTLVTSKWQKLS